MHVWIHSCSRHGQARSANNIKERRFVQKSRIISTGLRLEENDHRKSSRIGQDAKAVDNAGDDLVMTSAQNDMHTFARCLAPLSSSSSNRENRRRIRNCTHHAPSYASCAWFVLNMCEAYTWSKQTCHRPAKGHWITNRFIDSSIDELINQTSKILGCELWKMNYTLHQQDRIAIMIQSQKISPAAHFIS